MSASILILIFPLLLLASCVYLDMTVGDGNKATDEKGGGTLINIGPKPKEEEICDEDSTTSRE